MDRLTIAVDGMGGDHAPEEIVEGALIALKKLSNVKVVLTGCEKKLKASLDKSTTPFSPEDIEIVNASEVIEMGESPIKALRGKKDSSIGVGIKLVKEGRAQAIVSMGNTGVAVASATLSLRMLPGVKRAGIAIPVPTFRNEKPCLMLDMGANVNSKPEHLVQYAIMGSIYSEKILGIKNPKVGLLNIGEETAKGNDLVKESYGLLEGANINFRGNAEGRDIYAGEYDVIVCDGFIGNIVLKASEGLVSGLMGSLKEGLRKNIFTRIGGALALPAFRGVKKKMDHSEFGGAPLLGVNGVVVIGHGSSNRVAVYNAIRCASESIEHKIGEHIAGQLI